MFEDAYRSCVHLRSEGSSQSRDRTSTNSSGSTYGVILSLKAWQTHVVFAGAPSGPRMRQDQNTFWLVATRKRNETGEAP